MSARDLPSVEHAQPERQTLARAQRRAASPDALRQMIDRTLASTRMHRARAGIRPRPGYEFLHAGGDRTAVYAVVQHSANDDEMVRRYGRVLRGNNFAVTYFVYEGRSMLRIDACVW